MIGSVTINNSGVVAYGTVNGQVTPIMDGIQAGRPTNAINASGQVVVTPPNPDGFGFSTVIINPDGSRVALGTPPNQSSFAGMAMNDSGQVVGYGGDYYRTAQAYLFSEGTFHSLGTLAGDVLSVPQAINNAGQVVGFSSAPDSTGAHAFLYSNGTMQALGTLGGTSTDPYGISKTGEVYGLSTTADGRVHAFLYANGQMIDLTNMLHSLGGSISQYQYYNIAGINDKGQILVQAQNTNTDFRSFLLTPDGQPLPAEPSSIEVVPVTIGPYSTETPEPSALALFALAIAACGARRGAGRIRGFVSGRCLRQGG